MAVLGKHLQDERGWSVLAIKADLLDAGVVTEADHQLIDHCDGSDYSAPY